MKLTTKNAMDEDDEIVEVPTKMTRSEGICKGEVALNLVLMSIMWICSSVNYQIINIYLKYIPGNEFLNVSIAGCSEILAHLTVGLLFLKLGPRFTFLLGYTIAGAGGACLLF